MARRHGHLRTLLALLCLALAVPVRAKMRIKFLPDDNLARIFDNPVAFQEFLLILGDTADRLSALISVKNPLPEDSLSLPEPCAETCGAFPHAVFSDHDAVIRVKHSDENLCGMNGLAYAAPCCRDARTDRPIAGYVAVCPELVSSIARELHGDKERREVVVTLLHEVTHIIAFSHTTMNTFRDEQGAPRVDRGLHNAPTRDIMRKSGLLETPAVAEAARRHFGCANLTGALLDKSKHNARFSHWDRAPLYAEYMEPYTQSFLPSTVSNMTLALFHDSGWYDVAFELAEPMPWGRGWGCLFALDECKPRGEDMLNSVFCDANKTAWPNIYPPGRTGRQCNYDRTAVGGCSNGDCPVVLPVFDCRDGSARDQGSADYFGEWKAEDAVCMQSTLRRIGVTTEDGMSAFCYRMRCPGDGGRHPLVLFYGHTDWAQCDENFTATSPNFDGFVACPRDRCGADAPRAVRPPYRHELEGLPPPPWPQPGGHDKAPSTLNTPSDAEISTPEEILTKAIHDVSTGVSEALYGFVAVFVLLMGAACATGGFIGYRRAVIHSKYYREVTLLTPPPVPRPCDCTAERIAVP